MTELEEKTDRLVRMMEAQDLGGVLLTTQPNFSWLTGGGSNGIDLSREAGAGALLVRRDGKRFVLANEIEMHRLLAEELSAEDFEPLEFSWEAEKTSGTFLTSQAAALLRSGTLLGTDGPACTLGTAVESAIASCRFQLTVAEVERYRALGRDAGEIIGAFMNTLTPGQSEREIARQAAAELGAREMHSVVLLVAADERIQRFRHPVPTALEWKRQLMVVVCARRSGLIASLTRLICVGEKPDELARRTLAAAQVNAALMAATRSGTSGAQLYHVAARAYAAAGFPDEEQLHHQGGATGYRTREWIAHPVSFDHVQVEQAFAWNPSITGTKIEETCIAHADSVEIITSSPNWPTLTIEVNGQTYDSPDVLSL